MATLFISHSSRDGAAIAQPLAAALEAAGHRCWIAPRDVKPGRPYPGQIVAAIRESDGLVLIVTPAANESPDVLQEVQLAGQHRKTVAPVIVDSTTPSDDLHYYLGVRHQIPWSDADATTAQLLRSFPAPEADDDDEEDETPEDFTPGDADANVGDIFLAKISQIDADAQIAWLDYGGPELGRLELSSIHPDYYRIPLEERQALLADPPADNDYRLEDVARPRQILLVQVTALLEYGVDLTTYLSLKGRLCKLLPNTPNCIYLPANLDDDEDAELEAIAKRLGIPAGMSISLLRDAVHQSEEDIRADYDALMERWEAIRSATLAASTPALIEEAPPDDAAPIVWPAPAASLLSPDTTGLFDVVMIAPGKRTDEIIAIISEYTGLKPDKARDLLNGVPPVRLAQGLTYLSAFAFAGRLRITGATVMSPVSQAAQPLWKKS